MTKEELLKALEPLRLDEPARNALVCALVGHSRIVKVCSRFYVCARCGETVGDGKSGTFDKTGLVIVGHGCPVCRSNYERLGWEDRLFCPDPFPTEEASLIEETGEKPPEEPDTMRP